MIKIVSTLLFVVASSCSAGNSNRSDGYLHYSLRAEPASFDPIHSANVVNAALQRQIIECLFEYDYNTDDATVSPLLAKRYEVSKSGTVYDIYLRSDAKFFDGASPALFNGKTRAVSAVDVLYCWLRQADSRNSGDGWWAMQGTFKGLDEFHASTASPDAKFAENAFDSAMTNGLEGLQVISDLHLRITTEHRDPWFLNRLAMSYFAVYPREAVETAQRSMRDQPVGSAVFHLSDFVPGQNVTMTQTPNWRQDLPSIAKGIDFQVVRDSQTTIELFKRGNSDRLTLSHSSANHFLDSSGALKEEFAMQGITMSPYPRSDISMLCFNMQDAEIGNVLNNEDENSRRRQLRHALALAFPREQWQELLYKNLPCIKATSFIPPNIGLEHDAFPWHDDLNKAREILTKAGYYSTHSLPELQFVLFGTDSLSIALGEIYANSLQELGIVCEIVAVPYAQQVQRAVNGNAQMFVRNWSLDWPSSALIYNTFNSEHIGSEINLSHFANVEFDRLLSKLELCETNEQRQQIEQQLDAILFKECPAVPIEHRQSLVLAGSRVLNFRMRPFDLMPCKSYVINDD